MDQNSNNENFNMQPNTNLDLNNTNTQTEYNNQILLGDVEEEKSNVSDDVDTIFSDTPATPAVPEEEAFTPVIKEKKNKTPIIIVVILVIIILGIGGYLAYDKFFANQEPKPQTNTKETKKEETKEKVKSDYYIKLDTSKQVDIYNRVVGKFKINNKYNDVKITKIDGESISYTLTIGENKIFTLSFDEFGLPDFIALMDEKYVAVFFQGSSENKILLYDLSGNKVETLGNSVGEINKIDDINDVIDSLVEDDKNFTYYECKFNNGVDTETLTEYSVKFENNTYTKDIISVKQNVTCLISG